jgi:hydroxymethylbilane synthase
MAARKPLARVLRLGTRRSLLARAQSGMVAAALERLNPGLRVELVGIDTRGDRIQDVPLQAVEGKDFFVAELDQALLERRVDLNVHSLKDLSLERPPGIVRAAMPRRENPRDVVLFAGDAAEAACGGRAGRLRIGTSSPRRQENLPAFLGRALPGEPRLELVEIRGNVNTRLGRLHEPAGSARRLDGVVLAFAGLIRLWADVPEGRSELTRLLRGARWMVLPLRDCPSAPGQGALAIECRTDDAEVRAIIERMHDEETAAHVERERAILAEWGGGCHQRFGATSVTGGKVPYSLHVRGRKMDGTFVDELRWDAPARPAGRVSPWDGSQYRGSYLSAPAPTDRPWARDGAAVFVAHSRALAPDWGLDWSAELAGARVWTSGTGSWFRMAREGIWVEGCAEGAGFSSLEATLDEAVLGLPRRRDWVVLTHEGARGGWAGSGARVVPAYRVAKGIFADAAQSALGAATHVFWSSGSQFDGLRKGAPAGAHHACGPGKTATHLRQRGLDPAVFPSVEEWRRWLGL